jgi:glycosyltransferase involved in cell wall biosynthesis
LPQTIKLFLSSTVWRQGGPTFISGAQDNSYGLARRKFETALRCLDVEIHDIPRPEIYAAPVSRAFLDRTSCHLIFKPAVYIRLIKGVRNIAWVTWDLDKLTSAETSGACHPFTDMQRMLTIPDEIWAPCEFTRRVFRAGGVSNVHRIPAPIAIPQNPVPIRFPDIPPDLDKVPWINLRVGFGRYGDINRSFPSRPHRLSDIIRDIYGGRQPLVILSILNPHEPRKNLTALIGGFLEFHSEHPASLLLLKLAVDNRSERLNNVLTGVLRSHISGYELIDSNAVWLTTTRLSPVLADLYRFSSSYLCSSVAEGQNLPLQEAMAWGVAPITTRHTAMLDYVCDDNSVIIRSQTGLTDRPDAALEPGPKTNRHVYTSQDVAAALRQFTGLDEDARRELGARARASIARDLSIAAVARLIQKRLFQQQ